MKKKENKHCVIRNEKLFCMNCGGERAIPYPIAVDKVTKIMDDFNKLHANCEPTYEHPVVDLKLSQREREQWWLKWGEQGQSSKSIFAKLSSVGLNERADKFPYDPDDFRRCHELLEAIPEFRKQLFRMKDVSDVWSNYVDNWDKLTEMFLDLKQNKKDNGMFDFMQLLYKKER